MKVPQPSPERLTEVTGNAIVVGVTPGQDQLVALTAASVARATGGKCWFAYVDTSRYVEEEFSDGTVDHRAISPDTSGDEWQQLDQQLRSEISEVMADQKVDWHFRYLAGRPDRALTHLARAIDAAMIVIGSHHAGIGGRLHDFFEASVSLRLTHHQHRPVLTVPLEVTDWKDEPKWH